MGLQEDKAQLLSQLTIDRSALQRNGFGLSQLLSACLGSAIAAGLLVYYLIGSSGDGGDVQPAHASTTAVVEQSSALVTTDTAPPNQLMPDSQRPVEILNASGYITARRIATVSAEIMGRIVSVDVEEGMQVQADQVLATLDDKVARVDLALAKAAVQARQAERQSLQADLGEARRVLKRVKQLDGKQHSSEAQLTRAQADVDKLTGALANADAQWRIAQLQVERQQEMLDDHTITAPFAGIITEKNAQPGEIVSPSSAGGGFTRTGICTLVDMGSLEIEVDVNEAFIGRVFSGQSVIANLDAYPDWDVPASVIAIIPTADRAKATVSVRIRIEQKDPRILPDMGVKVAFLKQQ